jgi:Ca2+:H+ antiporter
LLQQTQASKKLMTLIIITAILNVAEYMTVILVARKDKLNLAMGVGVGSCIHVVLHVIPLLVLFAWGVDSGLVG